MSSGEHVMVFLEGRAEPLVVSAVPLAEDDRDHEEEAEELARDAEAMALEVEEEEQRRARQTEELMLEELFPRVEAGAISSLDVE
jgi:hypothetical protein